MEIRYIATEASEGRGRFGIFTAKNFGNVPFKLPVEGADSHEIVYMHADVEIRTSDGKAWITRAALLDQWYASDFSIAVEPGAEERIVVDSPSVFGGEEKPREYTVMFLDRDFRCSVRSEPFYL